MGDGRFSRRVDEFFKAFSDPLLGLPITHYWRGSGTALFIEFGDLSMAGRRTHPRGRMSLQMLTDWRVEGRRSILCGSTTDLALAERSLRLLNKGIARSTRLMGRLNELEIELSCDIRIQSFACGRGDPQWSLIDNGEFPKLIRSVGARSGGLVPMEHAKTLKNVTAEEFVR